MASSNALAIYEKDGRFFKMTAEHAERVGATPVDDDGGSRRRPAKKAPAARNKKAAPAADKATDETSEDGYEG